MQINVSRQLRAPVGSTYTYHIDDVTGINGYNCRVFGEVKLTRTDRSILVKGIFKTELELTCSRCLEVYICPLRLDIEEEYFPTVDVVSGTKLAVPSGAGGFYIDKYHTIDLSEAIRQYALMCIPMKPLCSQNCAGLCTRCGHNLNRGACTCPSEGGDLRWVKLRELAFANNKKSSSSHKKGA